MNDKKYFVPISGITLNSIKDAVIDLGYSHPVFGDSKAKISYGEGQCIVINHPNPGNFYYYSIETADEQFPNSEANLSDLILTGKYKYREAEIKKLIIV